MATPATPATASLEKQDKPQNSRNDVFPTIFNEVEREGDEMDP
jgi:hypothetical protein